MESGLINGAVIAQIVGLIGIIAKLYFDRMKSKKESNIVIESVRGMESKVLEMVFEQKGLKSDFRFPIKLHNKLNKIANRYSNKFGLTGEDYGKVIFFWAKSIEQFASDYYFSDFRVDAAGEKSELKDYISLGFNRNKDEFLDYVNKLFEDPKYDNKNKPYLLHQMIEGSLCFTAYDEILIMDLLQNGFTPDTFIGKIGDYLCKFLDEFERISKQYIKYGEPRVD